MAQWDRRETPVHGVFPARSKLHRAQTGARLRVAPGTYVPTVAIRATEIPPIQPVNRGFPEVSQWGLGERGARGRGEERSVACKGEMESERERDGTLQATLRPLLVYG